MTSKSAKISKTEDLEVGKKVKTVALDQNMDSMSCVSTQLPDDHMDSMSCVSTQRLDEKDSGDSMDTSTASKRSKARNEEGRGPARKDKRIARAKAHKTEVLGIEWKDKEAMRVENAEKALPGCKGTIAVAIQSSLLDQAKEEKAPDDDEKRQIIEEALIKEIPVNQKRWIQMIDGEPRCIICDKQATEGHVVSSEHVKRIEEDCIGDLNGGKSKTTRRFNGDLCTGVPTKKKMYDFWGDALENLVKVAMEIHQKKGFLGE